MELTSSSSDCTTILTLLISYLSLVLPPNFEYLELLCLNIIVLYLSKASLTMTEVPPLPPTVRERSGSIDSVVLPKVKYEGNGHRYTRDSSSSEIGLRRIVREQTRGERNTETKQIIVRIELGFRFANIFLGG